VENKNSRKKLQRVTVYVSSSLKNQMETFKKGKGFNSLSNMLKTGFFIMQQVLGSKSSMPYGEKLEEQLDRIEKRLEEIQLEKEVINKQEEIIDNEFNHLTKEEIPNYSEIANAIIDLISEYDGIKDFVLMEHLRKNYSEGIIWAVLNKLHQEKQIKIKDGIWKNK